MCITLEPYSFDKLIVIMGNKGFEPWMSSLGTLRSANLASCSFKPSSSIPFGVHLNRFNVTHTHPKKKKLILTFRVRLVGGEKRWEDIKWGKDRKVGG